MIRKVIKILLNNKINQKLIIKNSQSKMIQLKKVKVILKKIKPCKILMLLNQKINLKDQKQPL